MSKKWTVEEENFVRVNWPVMNIRKLTEEFNKKFGTNRSASSIDNKVDRMDLINKRNYSRINNDNSEAELEVEGRKRTEEFLNLIENIGNMDKLRFKLKGDDGKCKRKVDGKVVSKNDSFVTLQIGKYKESFLYTDFLIGEAMVI